MVIYKKNEAKTANKRGKKIEILFFSLAIKPHAYLCGDRDIVVTV